MFLEPLGLFALLGLPLVIALHLLRRRFRPQPVSALFLWDTPDHSPTAGPRRERLRQSMSLWLELLAALLLALWFAGLKGCSGDTAEHLVLVIDGSASMGAITQDGALTARALAAVHQRLDDLPRGSRVTLIESGPVPETLAGPAVPVDESRAALARYRPDRPRHDPRATLDLARQLAAQRTIVFVTDALQDATPADVEWIAIGEPLPNVAITHAARSRTGAGERVFVTLTAFAEHAVDTHLHLLAERVELASHALRLEPSAPTALTLELPPDAGTLHLRIDDDALAIDNEAWLAAAPDRTIAIYPGLSPTDRVTLGLQSPGADAALADRLLAVGQPARLALSPDAADLVVGGEAAAHGVTLAIDVGAGPRRDLLGPFLIEKQHPLLDGLTLDGVVWSVDESLTLPGAPIVSAGNLPLLTEWFDHDRRRYALNFDIHRSTLQRSPDWPILLANLAGLARAELPGPARSNLAVGETLLWRFAGPGRVVISGDEYHAEYPTQGTLDVAAPTRPGRYRLTFDDRPCGDFTVSFVDAAESDLRQLGAGERRVASPLPQVTAAAFDIDLGLIVAILIVVLADWWVLRERGAA